MLAHLIPSPIEVSHHKVNTFGGEISYACTNQHYPLDDKIVQINFSALENTMRTAKYLIHPKVPSPVFRELKEAAKASQLQVIVRHRAITSYPIRSIEVKGAEEVVEGWLTKASLLTSCYGAEV